MTEPRRWSAVTVVELSGWRGSEDNHWMTTPDGAPGIHGGSGGMAKTCSICRDGCDWSDESGDCGDPPVEMLTGWAVSTVPATLLDPEREESEPVTLLMCAEHAERARTEPVEVVPIDLT